MVAMSGAIMPEPLAKPLSVTGTPSIFALRVAPLGKVSVVRMARAASDQPSVHAAALARRTPAIGGSSGNRSGASGEGVVAIGSIRASAPPVRLVPPTASTHRD